MIICDHKDFFRFDENGKIVEALGILQQIPKESANPNTWYFERRVEQFDLIRNIGEP